MSSTDRQKTSLDQLEGRQTAVVDELTNAIRGAERRRLLDLGITPGTSIQRQFAGPMGSPTVFKVRGTNIGLRPSQTRHIKISIESAEDQHHA